MAGVRLDTREGAMAALTAGKAETSRIYLRVSHADPKRRMPPPSTGRTLTPAQVATIKEWIDAGAQWQQHWAYQTPQRPELPAVKNAKWARNEIDRFVLARLEKEKLVPAGEAERTTLLRRLSFDLTGLPPTPAEVAAFVSDKSANAYEKQVDRLLASPHYGERMALGWLDLARYADTHGFHIDSHRDMWPWRDWVINAYNSNMGFDRFTVEQLAGDLLPDATREQKVASGFNRNHMINYEGGAIPEEYLVEYIADRAETTATVWMAMTIGCARCHDHKYDPIPQKDYYRLFAFFNRVPEKGLDGRDGNAAPFLALPEAAQKQAREALEKRIKELETGLEEKQVAAWMEAWEKQRTATASWAGPDSLRRGLVAQYEMDGGLAESSGNYLHGRALRGEPALLVTGVGKATSFGAPSHVELGRMELGREFSIAGWLIQGYHQPQTILQQDGVVSVWWDSSYPMPHLRRGAHLHVAVPGKHVRTAERLVQNSQYHLAIVRGASGAVTVYVNDEPAALVEESAVDLGRGDSMMRIGEVKDTEDRDGFRGRIADLRFYKRALEPGEVRYLRREHRLAHMFAIPAKQRPKELTAQLKELYLRYEAEESARKSYAELVERRAELARLDDEIPSTMVMGQMEKARDTFVLGRGDYRNHGEKVSAATPGVLPPMPQGIAADRLALARWLVDPQHPLTARVAVNRYWQQYFGVGLVKSAENFGSQGEPPSHPELLDWLATEFVRSGWDVKAMQKKIVMSATYRQSSKATPELVERDPENRLLARMSRFRLQAELVRDNALAVSGLLNTKIGGKSVYPYQPPGIWEEIARGEIFSAQVYEQSHGEDLYRRSMYWFWKRTAPPASLATFDAPDREKCVARRSVTNTPLQALVLMNDPTYVEAARVLAQRVLPEMGADAKRRVEAMFRRATGRAPAAAEMKVLLELAGKQMERYGKDAKSAAALLGVGEYPVESKIPVGELAAWTNVAAVILNLDETVTKE